MKDSRAGFTLIELLVVIGILSLLVVTFAPDIIGAWSTANSAADAANMRQVYQWIEIDYKNKTKHYPMKGGHKFVLGPWVEGTIPEKTIKNFDRFFNPALRASDPQYIELRKQDIETIWTSYEDVSSLDTTYAGRAKEFMHGIDSGKEAWMADDNEDGWSFKDGSINVLYGNGDVITLSSVDLREKFQWMEIKKDEPFPSYGPESPAPDLRKLDR